MGSTTSASSVNVIRWQQATGKRISGSDGGQPDSVVRPPAVPLVERLTSGKPSAGAMPTATRTETAVPTAMTELSESSMDVVDVVTCTETGLALTDSDVATVETVAENTHTPIDIYETIVKSTHTHYLHSHPLFLHCLLFLLPWKVGISRRFYVGFWDVLFQSCSIPAHKSVFYH